MKKDKTKGPERLLGLSDIARELGCSVQVVSNWYHRGNHKLPPPLFVGPNDAPLWRRPPLVTFGLLEPIPRDTLTPEDRKIRARANSAVLAAVKRGDLVPQPCEECGHPPNGMVGKHGVNRRAVLAHHDDYSNPLGVRWLCTRCHGDWHSKNVALPHPVARP